MSSKESVDGDPRGHSPDSRDIDDISAVEKCSSCGWSPAAVLLVDGDDGSEWECYNCGRDPDESDGDLLEVDDDLGDDQDQEREIPDIYDREDVLDQVEDAPPRASVTTKTIDGRDYYYYQWREGDRVKSEYIGPVDPA